MGNGKEYICKNCGEVWWQMIGVGMRTSSLKEIEKWINKPAPDYPDPVCPECGSEDNEETGNICLWD